MFRVDAGDSARARIVDQAGGNAGHFILVLFDVRLGATQALLLPGEENEPDRPPRLGIAFRKQPGCFQHDDRAGAVIGCALAEVPRIEMRADNDHFVGLFRRRGSRQLCC